MIPKLPEAEGLTDRRKLFCENYVLNGGNATKACRDAGYKCNTDSSWTSVAFETLTSPDVTAYIEALRKAIRTEFGVTAEEVIAGLREVRKRALKEEPVFDADGIETGEFTSDLSAANRSIEMLGKVRGMFTDRIEMNLSVTDIANAISGEVEQMDVLE